MNFNKRPKPQQAGFQMAPMIDIMFLLLIFFMSAFIFAQWERKLGIQIPTADTGVTASTEPGEVIINLDAEGKIYINSIERTPEQLETLLHQIADAFVGQPIIIRADRKTDHEYVVMVLDICRKVDIWNIAFAALPPVEGKDEN